jgi:hypothetical protein
MGLSELLLDVVHVESHFGLFGCNIGAWFTPNVPLAQKIILDEPGGTPW